MRGWAKRQLMTREEHGMLDDLLGLEEGLSSWEVEFVESLAKKRKFSRENVVHITMGQSSKLGDIYKERMG